MSEKPVALLTGGGTGIGAACCRALAGRDILVNSAILARIPQQRMGTPREVTAAAAFLATRGNYINGTVIHANGGMLGG